MPLEQADGPCHPERSAASVELSLQTLIRQKINIFNRFEECRQLQPSRDVGLDVRVAKER